MNRIISINIKGIVFQIEEDAFEVLKNYLERLKFHFRNHEGSEEIIDDIEFRIAEMLESEPGKAGIVHKSHIEKIIAAMGNPVDFTDAEESEFVPEKTGYRRYRRLFRDPDNKMLGGVCGGIGTYFDLDPLWIRILFLIAFFGFGGGLILYIILWAIVPEARTSAEKLEMRGEKVTIENIEKTIRDEFAGLKKNFSGEGKEKVKSAARQGGRAFTQIVVSILTILAKIFGLGLIITATIVLFALGLSYFGFIPEATKMHFYPFYSLLFEEKWLAGASYLCLILLILIPLVGLIFTGIRLVSGNYRKTSLFGRTLGSLWGIALLVSIATAFYLGAQWREDATLTQEFDLGSHDTLFLESINEKMHNQKSYNIIFGRARGIRGAYLMEDDSLKRPILLDVVNSSGKTIVLEQQKRSHGYDAEDAVRLAEPISTSFHRQDKHLSFNAYFSVDKNEVWKGQEARYVLHVPVGTVVHFGKNTGRILNNIVSRSYISVHNAEGKSFVMGEEGLITNENLSDNKEDYTKLFDFTDFEKVEVNGYFDLTLVQQDKFLVALTSDEDIVNQVKVQKKGNRLTIEYNPLDNILSGAGRPKFTIGVPDLTELDMNGNIESRLTAKNLRELDLDINGACNIVGDFVARKLSMEMTGANRTEIRGKTETADIEINGVSVLEAGRLEIRNLNIELNGSSKAVVNCFERMNADLVGPSILRYKYHPELKQYIDSNPVGKVESF